MHVLHIDVQQCCPKKHGCTAGIANDWQVQSFGAVKLSSLSCQKWSQRQYMCTALQKTPGLIPGAGTLSAMLPPFPPRIVYVGGWGGVWV